MHARVIDLLNRALIPFDAAVVRRSSFLARFKTYNDKNRFVEGPIPQDAVERLRPHNPELMDYKRRYEGHPATDHSVWKPEKLDRELNLASFRADNAYIWQMREMDDVLVDYAFATLYVEAIDKLGLFRKLDEDGSFGAVALKMDDGKIVSRDLLDSIIEINLLERYLSLSRMPSVSILDIGAGYGRLAHRLVKSLPTIRAVLCVDAIPESTFLCQYYLRYRGVLDRAKVIPLDMIEKALDTYQVDIVTNIHSFQECTVKTISWWLNTISKCRPKYFLLAHYADELLSAELDGTKKDFRPLIEMRGFELVEKEPVYAPGSLASRYGLYPKRWYYLFRNDSWNLEASTSH